MYFKNNKKLFKLIIIYYLLFNIYNTIQYFIKFFLLKLLTYFSFIENL